MRFLSILSFGLLFSGATFATECPNLAGHFAMEVNASDPTPVDLMIEQSGCEELLAHYESADGKKFDRPMIVDGKMHPTVVTGAFTVMEAFIWKDGQLAYQQEIQAQGRVTQANGSISIDGDALAEETTY
ncbi:MAG: hypothetical protein AABZ55_13590, partial [Bdellovibrionota bacterium]